MSDKIKLVRYRIQARPHKLSPFKLGWAQDPSRPGRWKRVWVKNARPVYVDRVGGSGRIALSPVHGYTSLLTEAEAVRIRKTLKKLRWVITSDKKQVLTIDKYPHLDGDVDADSDLLRRLEAVGKELGKKIFIRSGRRTIGEQWDLYNQLGPGIAAYPSPSAPHVRGIAADVGIDGRDIGDYPGARRVMRKHGLCLPVPGEDWHVQVGSNWAV